MRHEQHGFTTAPRGGPDDEDRETRDDDRGEQERDRPAREDAGAAITGALSANHRAELTAVL